MMLPPHRDDFYSPSSLFMHVVRSIGVDVYVSMYLRSFNVVLRQVCHWR
jgi:hypothetical protein